MSGLATALVAYLDDHDLDELARLLAPRLRALDERQGGPRADDRLLTVAGAARYVNTHPETVRRAIRAGALRAVGQVGRSPRLAQDDLDAWLARDRRGRRTSRRPPTASRHGSSGPLANAMAGTTYERGSS
jgi:excisionase family DNA binding protein